MHHRRGQYRADLISSKGHKSRADQQVGAFICTRQILIRLEPELPLQPAGPPPRPAGWAKELPARKPTENHFTLAGNNNKSPTSVMKLQGTRNSTKHISFKHLTAKLFGIRDQTQRVFYWDTLTFGVISIEESIC